jgi:Ran GTPase-activating protein (RanGAP) involved in mRNA processing and transport
MVFLSNMVNQGKLLRKKTHKGIDEDNIVKLDLSRNDFGPLDIKYLTDFDLKNLRILDLSSNSIKPQGAFYLSQGKFSCLESLNLNFNEIGDEGLNHIANGFFSKLLYLYLFHNNISVEGIKYLVKAEFVNNLIILSLSENPNIGDSGIRIIKEHKGWSKLNTLNLNATGLTDDALKYLGEASMPKLKKLNILGNKFTDSGKPSINGLRMNHIHVSYRTQAERDKEKERRKNEAKKK